MTNLLHSYSAEKLTDLLFYNPDAPMLFNSGAFLVFFALFMTVYGLLYPVKFLRVAYVLAFSLFFYYKSSGIYVLLLTGSILFNYLFGLSLDSLGRGKKENAFLKKLLLTIGILANLGVLAYFKYTNFFIENLNKLAELNFREADIFLPIGISFFTFQAISYIVDVYRKDIKAELNVLNFGFYLSFFPQLVAGPIVRARDFLPQISQKIILKREDVGRGLFLILSGLLKKAVIADYIALYSDMIFGNPAGYSGFENLIGVYTYTLQIYCDFSGYSDMAIGLGLIMGFRLCENFRSPYQATNITDFWRRWHISLSTWLRDYLYIPLGGNRKGKFRQYLNLFLTMLLGGLWHGASWKFVIWGGMHGVGLAVHKLWHSSVGKSPKFLKPLAWLLTFHFVAALWVFFRAESFDTAVLILERVITETGFDYIEPFRQARPLLCALLLLGFGLHVLPQSHKTRISEAFALMPWYIKLVAFFVVIQLMIQLSNENVQPFIYYQF